MDLTTLVRNYPKTKPAKTVTVGVVVLALTHADVVLQSSVTTQTGATMTATLEVRRPPTSGKETRNHRVNHRLSVGDSRR